MKKAFFLLLCGFLFFGCKETVFEPGLENRLTAIIDMSPESYENKVDFTSDDEVSGCADHDLVFIDQHDDGSIDNEHFTIRIEARDYFRSENNCNDYDWSWTDGEKIEHKLVINAFASEITNSMYLQSTQFVDHPNNPTSGITAYYKLKINEGGNDNDGNGVEYFGHHVELDIVDLDLDEGVMSGTFNATLYRGTAVNDPNDFIGVDNFPNLDLYNPQNFDFIGDLDGDGTPDYYLTDSIRIENGVFQNITIVNNIPG